MMDAHSESNSDNDLNKTPRYHMGIAERGKMHAVNGDHQNALKYYRYAIKLTTSLKHPEIFFRHYLECILESLEHMEAYNELLEYCDKALALFGDHKTLNENNDKNIDEDKASHEEGHEEDRNLIALDIASVYLRKGIVFYKLKQLDDAKECFSLAKDALENSEHSLPLLDIFQRWLNSNLYVDAKRIQQEQNRHKYFSVQAKHIKKDMAIDLPESLLAAAF